MAKQRREILETRSDIVWTLDIPRGIAIPVTAELVGGGGGGGGNDASSSGGSGSAGQYLKYNFTVSQGDKLSFVIGGGGGAGASSASSAAGGTAGTSVIGFPSTLFNLRTIRTGRTNYAKTDPRWSSFMNNNAVWESNTYDTTYDRTYIVTFPTTGTYQWQIQCDNIGRYYQDGVEVASTSSFTGKETIVPVYATAGQHTIRVLGSNSGDVGGICLVISRNITGDATDDFSGSLSGGRGGNAGPSGSSGGGGGGGGASAILLNGEIIAIAGGGGGGGGAGVNSAGATAGNTPLLSSGFFNGQAGQPKRADGGGGGASGGGKNAGAGGNEESGDRGAAAGDPANCWALANEWGAPIIQYGSGRNPFIPSEPGPDLTNYGKGGLPRENGTSGYIRLTFDVSFASYKYGNKWVDVNEIYYKTSQGWVKTEGYYKSGGEWQPLARGEIALYNTGAGIIGTEYRDLAMVPEPAPVYYSYNSDSSWYSDYWSSNYSYSSSIPDYGTSTNSVGANQPDGGGYYE